jgi:hypothetical protein
MNSPYIQISRDFSLAILLAASLYAPLSQADDYGNAYVDQNPNSFVFINPSIVTWPNNQVEWLFKTNNLINSDLLVSYVTQATANYQKHADINFTNSGATSLDLALAYNSSRQNTLLIEVLDNSTMDSFVAGITNGADTNGSRFGGYAWMWWDGSILAGQIALNSDFINSENCWKGIINHEIGHVLNLQHSDTKDSIMFSEPYNSCNFQQTLRYDDIKGLHQMYPENEPNYEVTITADGCLYIPNIEFQGTNYQVRKLCVFEIGEGSITVNQ